MNPRPRNPGALRLLDGVFLAALLGLALRLVYVWGTLLAKCPVDRGRILMFLMVSVILAWAPGLFLRRWLGLRTANPILDLTFMLTAGLTGSAFAVWCCYGLGFYTRPVLVGVLVVLAAGGVYGAGGLLLPAAQFPARLKHALNLSRGDDWVLVCGAWLALGLFEQVVGTPMVSWDALTSWDKWAADAGQRPALGRYALGGYPQFLPMLGSVFYKLTGSGAAVFPIEHLLLHGLHVQFLLLLVFALLALGRTLGVPGGIVLVLLLGNRLVFEMVTENIGSVDIPFAAMLCAACALGFAYARGDWGTASGGWRDSAALFLPLLAVPFMKGNGLAWMAVLFAALCAELRNWRRIRLVGAPFLAALALSLAYVFHQVWFGAWHWEMSELSPFLRSHTFVAAHTKQFVLSQAHLGDWAARCGAAWDVTIRHGGEVLIVAGLCLCLWAARDRNLRFFAITGPLGLVIWFFTASYDFRNAAAPLAMVLVAGVGVLWSGGLRTMGRGRVRLIPYGLLALAALWSLKHLLALSILSPPVGKTAVFMHQRAAPESLFARSFRDYRVPKMAALPPDRRHMGVRPWGDLREILYQAPFGKRAVHLLAADGLYRVLAPRGVYMMHKNRYRGQQRFDVALGEPYLKPPVQYEKVARFKRVAPYNFPVRIFQPEFHTVAMQIPGRNDADIREVEFKAGETQILRFGDPEHPMPWLKEGVLSLELSPPQAEATLVLAPEATERDPYAAYFESVTAGAHLRLLYWMNDDRPDLPRFVLQVGSNDLRIVKAEWGR